MAGAQAAWGLDVGVTSLKAMKLHKEGDKVVLEAFDIVEHDTFLSEPDVDKDEIIRSTLRKFLDRNPIRRDTLFIGVPGSSTFARFVKLPPVDPKKIPEIVRFEAIQQIPFPLDQVNWDYQTFANPDSPEVEVGIFAMKQELVGQVLANFRSLGLTVHGVQMSPLAVYNAAFYDGLTDGKGTVVIDMGAEHTDLVIMDQGRLWLRTINIGGNHFTDSLAKSFKQSFNRAEQLKKTAATSKYQKQIFQAMRPIFADLVAEIQRSVGHYNSSHRDSRLERIIGMGNPFKLPNLQKYLQQELKMEVIRLDHFHKVTADGRLAPGLTENILPMTASYGLAIQGLGLAPLDTNLLPLEIARQMLWKRKRSWFYAAAALVVVGVGAVGYQEMSSASAYEMSTKAAGEANDGAIRQANKLSTDWRNADRGSSFDQDKHRAEEILKLCSYRLVWPMLNRDLLDALPQAHAGGVKSGVIASTLPADVKAVVLMGIDSEYTVSVSTWGTASDKPIPTVGTVASSLPDDHGFGITLRGYTSNGGERPQSLLTAYENELVRLAPKNGSKPYYFETIRGGTKGDPDLVSPWGASRTLYWQEFWEDVTGLKPDIHGVGPAAVTPKSQNELSDMDLFRRSSSGEKPPSLKDNPGDFRFFLQIKVHLRDQPK